MTEYLTKSFSPSYDRRKYEKMVKGFSFEFCHNVMRLIARPMCISANHWESECQNWLYRTVMAKVTVRRTPMNLFDEFLDDVKTLSWNEGFIEAMRLMAVNEAYGRVKNNSYEYARQKLMELVRLVQDLSDNDAMLPEIYQRFHEWRLSINRK